MLGVRLGENVERRFERFVRAQGRGKSDIARTAIVEYMDRHSLDAEFARQVRAIADEENADPALQDDLTALDATAWRSVPAS